MQLLGWTGKPVLVLLNQLGAPRAPGLEAAELEQWRERLTPWPHVGAVLPLDAFARCWVHEAVLLRALRDALAGSDGGADAERHAAMDALLVAWTTRRQAQFDAAMSELAASLVRTAWARETVPEPAGLAGKLRDWGARLVKADADDPVAAAQQRLAAALEAEVRASTRRLVEQHGLASGAAPGAQGSAPDATTQVLARVATLIEPHRRVPEGRAAVLGGAITGALAGLKADIASGGLTLGGGLLAGGILGALGAAGLARGINVVRGTGRSWVAWSAEALPALTEAALLRYLAVAHYGRGRGEWAQAEAPPHWPAAVAAALAPRRDAFERLWKARGDRSFALACGAGVASPIEDNERLAAALQPLLAASARDLLVSLYPAAPPACR
jgi:hypothetical protein